MADKKGSQFTLVTAAQLPGNAVFPIIDPNESDPANRNKGITAAQLKVYLAGASKLGTPAGFTATATSQSQINLVWNDVANESGYQVDVSQDGGVTWTPLASPVANATNQNQTGLSAGNVRHYRLKAVGNGTTYLDSDYAYANATTQSAPAKLQQPTVAVSNLANNGFRLTINPMVPNATGYTYAIATDSNFGNVVDSGNINLNTLIDFSGGQAGTPYYWRVKARDGNGVYQDSSFATGQVTTTGSSGYYGEWGQSDIDRYSATQGGAVPTAIGGASFANGAAIVAPLGAFTQNKYIWFRLPTAQPNKTTWYNTGTNNGQIPDSVFYDVLTVGGYDYYFTRVPYSYDATQETTLS